jgi:hypothetical protein
MGFGVPAMSIDFDAEAPQHSLPCRHHFGHYQAKLLRLLERPSLSWLIYADAANLIEIFPAKSTRIEALLGTIVVQGPYWSKIHLAKQVVAAKLEKEFPHSGNWKEFWRQVDTFVGMTGRLKSRWLLLALCLEFTVDILVGQKEFRRRPQHLKTLFRDEICKEIDNIDDKIHTSETGQGFKRDTTPQCARAEMYIRSAALIYLEPFRKLLVRRQAYEEFEHSQIIKSEPGFEAAGDLLIAIHRWDISHPPHRLSEAEDVFPEERRRIFGQVFQRMIAGDLNIVYQSLSNLASQFDESIDLAQSPISPPAIDPIEFVSEQQDSIKSKEGQHHPVELMMEQDDLMRELLIYRAVLAAIHSLTVLDNSDILELGTGKQIVPFL